MNVVDSSAWLEYFADGPNAKAFAPVIEATTRLIVPVISIYEVYKKVKLERGQDQAIEAVAMMMKGHVVDVDVSLALVAADLSLDEQIPMADAILLSTARQHGATFWTQDAHFANMADVKFFVKR